MNRRTADVLGVLTAASITCAAFAAALYVWDRIPAMGEYVAANLLDGIDGAWR